MGRYLLKRLSQAVLVVISVMVVVFVVTRLIGDPVAVMLPLEATEENRAILEAQLGLDRPILVQLGDYIADAVQLDLGDSLWQRRPAIDIVMERLPPTIILVAAGFALGVLLGVVIGVISGMRPGGWVDRGAVTLGLLGVSLPQFWIGLVFIVFFSVGLGWFPTSGSGGIEYLVLPAFVLALPIVGRIALVTRSSMIDELNAQHVKDATARGVSRARIVIVHAFKGAGIATITIAGWELIGALAGGAVGGGNGVRVAGDRVHRHAGHRAARHHPRPGCRVRGGDHGGHHQHHRGCDVYDARPPGQVRSGVMSSVSSGAQGNRRRSAVWLRRIVRDPTALFGVLVLVLLVSTALFAPLIAPLDPNKQDLGARLLPPFYAEGGSFEHILGTDQLGRDVFSRIIHGARISLTIPLVAVTMAGLFGTAVGLLAGYRGGRTDAVIMRIVDTLFSFPGLLLALTILAVVGPSFWTLAIVLSLRIWMVFARMTRGLVLSAREAEYVEAAELIGASPVRIMMRHIAPNLTAPLLTLAVLESAHVILSEAALSFLGLGIQPPQTSWGLDVAIGRQYVFSAPWLIIFPGLAIAVAVLGINLLASWLRVAADPEESAKRFAAAADAPAGWSG